MKLKCLSKDATDLRRKTTIAGFKNTIVLKAKKKSPNIQNKPSLHNNHLNLRNISKIPKPLFSSSPIKSLTLNNFKNSHTSTLSNSFRCSSIFNATKNASQKPRLTHQYSIKTISENERDNITDEAEIAYCLYIQELFKESQNDKKQSLECQNLIEELEWLSAEKDKLKIDYTLRKKLYDTIINYENLKLLIGSEKTYWTAFCGHIEGLMPAYKLLVNSLEIQENKLPLKHIYPAIPPIINAKDDPTDMYEMIENMNNLLKSGENIVANFCTENLPSGTFQLLKQTELISNLEDCVRLSKELENTFNLEIELRALNLSKSEDI